MIPFFCPTERDGHLIRVLREVAGHGHGRGRCGGAKIPPGAQSGLEVAVRWSRLLGELRSRSFGEILCRGEVAREGIRSHGLRPYRDLMQPRAAARLRSGRGTPGL
ncbi:hypothetical protein NDU88_003865 [Pleurodeles waltl]|uniref:Uncharacterized protein n=1 Tax=Pleurodeles waltl TaxID=8319 RepID=A0AAV7T6B9_PLEWA|nr:hypothetical protein NDU88_003865 [Pleurodeles waltl]